MLGFAMPTNIIKFLNRAIGDKSGLNEKYRKIPILKAPELFLQSPGFFT